MTTTARLRHWVDRPLIIVGAALVIVLMAGLASGIRHWSPAATTPTPGLIILIATQAPVSITTSQERSNVTRGALIAYDAPEGKPIGAIEAGRVFTPTASYGAEWLQADVRGSGLVWLRAAALLGMPAGLTDLQPTATPVIVVHEAPASVGGNTPATTPPDWYHDIATPPPAFVQGLIDPSRPDAPACENPTTHQISPLCGDLTNAEAMTAIAR